MRLLSGLLLCFSLLCQVKTYAQEELKLVVVQEDPKKEIRFLSNVGFDVYVKNTGDKPRKVVDPNKTDRFWRTHYSRNILIVNNKADTSTWFVEGPESKFSSRALITLKPNDSLLVYICHVKFQDTVEHKLIVTHSQMNNVQPEVIAELGAETVKNLAFHLSSQPIILKPAYYKPVKDNLNISYEEIIAPPGRSQENPSLSSVRYGTYFLADALSSRGDDVYKLKVTSEEMYLTRFLPLLKNLRWIQFDLKKNDSIPESISQLDKLLYVEIKMTTPKDAKEIKEIYIEPIKSLDNLCELNISNTYNKTFPKWMGNFKNLKVLNLFNAFYDYSPEIARLTNLVSLTIDGRLKQTFPKEIGTLNNIRNLTIRGVYTPFPDEILRLPNLEKLELTLNIESPNFEGCNARKIILGQYIESTNPLKGLRNLTRLDSLELTVKCMELPDLSGCNSLSYLKLSHSGLIDFPVSVTTIPNLQKIIFDCKKLTNITSEIAEFKNLKSLLFNASNIQVLPDELGQLKSLIDFSVSNGKLTEFPTVICQLENLETLFLIMNKIPSLPQNINQLKKLRVLNMSNNLLAVLPKEIGELSKLEQLELATNQISKIPDEIASLKKLKSLNLIGNKVRDIPRSVLYATFENNLTLYLRDNNFAPSIQRMLEERKNFNVKF